MILLDALEVKMIRDKDTDEVSDVLNFRWNVAGYDKDWILLQIQFENPELVGTYASKDYISVTFWGVDFFKDEQGYEVELGTELLCRVMRQLGGQESVSI